MIIVKLMGGLGNQMFQYAAGRSLALRRGTSLKLDLSFLEGYQANHTRRSFELERLDIRAEKATPGELAAVERGEPSSLFQRTLGAFFKRRAGMKLFLEKQFNVNPEFFELPDQVYLEGFWQSEGYFKDYGDIIRREFTPSTAPVGKNLELMDEIRSVNAVSLHIRRGDYVTDPAIRAAHHVCELDYYQKGAEVMASSLQAPHFFVFSDDSDWVAANLKLQHPTTFVSHNQGRGYEDLRLMSLCRHHIIANSSFSWWGAWLNPSPDKIVCAPGRWFNEMPANTCDLIPQGWRKI
ncbi:MAG: hypothetical protein A2075_15665 [Geobacteraceae bacterium GWC2_58_44]|nr:MAG: hypothetical protein A2075_15665 [Geobacteraceae bacterium GWC2_58_44]HBG06022.1 alpha-1,2-fucosyltransferase [Geobacter sp.]